MKKILKIFSVILISIYFLGFSQLAHASISSIGLSSSSSVSDANGSFIDFTLDIQATEAGNFIQIFVQPNSGPGSDGAHPLSSGLAIPGAYGTFEVFSADMNLAASNIGGFLYNNSYNFFQPSSSYVFQVYEVIPLNDGTVTYGNNDAPFIVFSCVTANENTSNDCVATTGSGNGTDLDGDGTIDDFNGDGVDDDLNNNGIPDYDEDDDEEDNNGTTITVNGPDLPNSNGGLIPCDGGEADPCDFNDFMALLNSAINFALFVIALPLAALGIMWTGFKILLNSTKANALSEAKSTMWNIVEGLVVALAAWLIIKAVLLGLGYAPVSGTNNDIFDLLNITSQ